MTEVLSAPGDGASYFSSSPLHRSSSHNLLSIHTNNAYLRSPPIKPSYDHSDYTTNNLTPAPSSAPSSPQTTHHTFSRETSYSSTPASCLSLDIRNEPEDTEDLGFPIYDVSGSSSQLEDRQTKGPMFDDDDDDEEEEEEEELQPFQSLDENLSQPLFRAADDQAIEDEPTRHVDYLSHEWKEEDIWSSWRYIVARRKVYSNSVRLENASWRTWTKAKNNLKTVSPETLNWLKDCDVTWLYGPLQVDRKKAFSASASPPPSRMSTSSSFLHKKPILKKKSASEAILQRSISDHSLLKQASAILKSQEASRSRPVFSRATSEFAIRDYNATSVANTPAGEESRSTTSLRASLPDSGLQSPGEKRHIHFNDEVVQCIAVESKEDDEEEDEERNPSPLFIDDDDEDEGLVMMKQVSSKAKLSNRSTPRGSFVAESKTIAPLPSTTLKYRSDTPEPSETQQQISNSFWAGGKLSPSPSQETIRPPRSNANFLIDDDDEDPDLQWQPSPASYSISSQQQSTHHLDEDLDDGYDPGPGMRRTPSGMFMPYDEDEEDAIINNGLFGRVVDTVNTARDIAHVIWNVGWRR